MPRAILIALIATAVAVGLTMLPTVAVWLVRVAFAP